MENLNNKTAIIIPIRMSSSRLPGKFHADIAGKPMIYHMIDRARETNFTNIFVACDHEDHFNLVKNYGATPILTGTHHQSGSDRVFEALNIIDPDNKFEYIINLQGDIPFVLPQTIIAVLNQLVADKNADISTMLTPLNDLNDLYQPNFVKAVFDVNHHALYFSRLAIPFSESPMNSKYYHHIGIYAYRHAALAKFIALPQSSLEITEKLEQLRALEHGMTIKVGFTDDLPVSVDVPEDLNRARIYAANRK